MIFASNNKDKIKQVKEYLGDNVYGLRQYGIDIDVVEDAETFEGNAIKKAQEIYNLTKQPVVADDSGLSIKEFDGWPGVYTHRFLGDNASSSDRNKYILEKMKDLPLEKRDCAVVCVLAYIDEKGKLYTFKGEFKSKISFKEEGNNFFGFDSIVYCDNSYTKTLAHLTDEQKLSINARGLALEKLKDFMDKQNS